MTDVQDPIVVDTNVLSWLLQSRDDTLTEQYRQLVGVRPIVVPFQVIAEIRYGMKRARWGEFRVRIVERALAEFSVAQPDDATLTAYAALRFQSIQAGHPLGDKVHDGDRWIAATAFRTRRPLVSHDSVFRSVDGLDLITMLSSS